MTSPSRRTACAGIATGWLAIDRDGIAGQPEGATPPCGMDRASVDAFDAACMAGALVRRPADLETWLASAGTVSPDPLAPLSPGGRRRMLASLVFREGHVIGIDTADLEAELTLSQAYRILAVFGWQALIVNLPEARIENDDDRAVAAWRARLAQVT